MSIYDKLIYFTIDKVILKKNKDGELKKFYKPPTKWEQITKLTYKNFINNNDTAYCILVGEINNLFVIDFDTNEQYHKYKLIYPILEQCFRVKTRKGYHCYFRYDDGLTFNNTKKNMKKINIDLLTNNSHVFGPYTLIDNIICYTIDYDGPLDLQCPTELITEIINESNPPKQVKQLKNDLCKKTNKIKNIDTTNNIDVDIIINTKLNNNDLIKELFDIISHEYRDSYSDWLKIIWSVGNNPDNYNLGLEFTKKSPMYQTEDYYKKIWDDNKGLISIGTFYYYANLSNKDKYYDIRAKYYNNTWLEIEDFSISKIYEEIEGHNWISNNKTLYKFNGVYWNIINDINILKKIMRYSLLDFYNRIRIELCNKNKIFLNNKSDDDNKINPYEKNIVLCCGIIKELKIQYKIINVSNSFITNITTEKDIIWNSKKYLLVFENGVYDLQKNILSKGNQDDYMSLSTGYDYQEETYDKITKIKDLIKQIFPIESERNAYMTILASGLIGQTQEYFIIANGGGGNGKGVLNELFLKSIGNYGTIVPNNIILNDIKAGNNPELCLLEDKRFVVMQEPSEGDNYKSVKINQSTMKQLTGGGTHKFKDLFQKSNKMEKNIYITLILECNKKPLLSGTIDESSSRRLIDVLFRSTFTQNKELLEHATKDDYIFEADTYYKSIEFKEEYKNSLMQIVLKDYLPEFLKKKENLTEFLPESIKERTKLYLEESDIWYSWIKDNYEFSEPPKKRKDIKYVQIKDIHEKFKISDYYYNMSKDARLKLSKKYFIENISTNKFFKIYYKKIHTIINDDNKKKTNLNNCILHCIEKVNNDDINNDDINNNNHDNHDSYYDNYDNDDINNNIITI